MSQPFDRSCQVPAPAELDESLDDFMSQKHFVWGGSNRMASWYREAGLEAVPLAVTDLMSGLQTGMIEAFPSTPLTALSMKAEMLAHGDVPAHRVEHYQRALYGDVRRLTQLVNKVLDFARLLPGAPKTRVQTRIIMAPRNLKRFLKALADNVERYEERHGSIPDDDPHGPSSQNIGFTAR